MQLIEAFDATQFDPTQSAGSLPIGKHPVVITGAEIKPVQAGDGGMLELTLKIVDGPQTGTTGPYRLNLYNKSQQAKEIAHRQLSAICHCVGVYQVTNASVLFNLPFLVEVGYQKGQEPGNPDSKGYTEIKKVFDRNGNEPGKAGQQAPAAQPQQQQQQGGFNQQQQPQGQQGGAGFANQGQQQQQAPQGQGGWGGGQQQGQQQPPAGQQQAAWAPQGQQQQQAQPQQQQQQAGGWAPQGQGQQQPAANGNAPWGQR